MTKALLSVQALHKSFGADEVLRGVDLEVQQGDRIAILGASGSGKSTLLRCLNFMEIPSSGSVSISGRTIDARNDIELTQVRQRVGMVFQQFNLFPHMTVLGNVMEALLTVKRMPRNAARELALAELSRVGLADALDPELVGEVLRVIRTLADEGRTMLLVTHELGFAYHVANRVLFIADGVIYEQGPPEQILKNPTKPRTQAFLARHREFDF